MEEDMHNLRCCLNDRLWRPAEGTFREVQKLALFKDDNLEEQGALICSVAAWFSNVLSVDIVLGIYSEGVDTDLRAIDPFNVSWATFVYRHHKVEKTGAAIMPDVSPMDVSLYPTNMELLKRMYQFWGEHGAEPRITPTVELKVLVSSIQWDEMERERRLCEERVKRQNRMIAEEAPRNDPAL